MPRLSRSINIALAAAVAAMVAGVQAPASSEERKSTACHPKALAALKRLAPEGWTVYERAKEKKFFTEWITCDNVQLGLTTAVHETVHMLTEEHNAYPLIMGGYLPRVGSRKRTFFPPRLTSHQFNGDSGFVTTYLKPGAATSAEEFDYLLNEFNAYTHDLHAAVQLVSVGTPGQEVYHRDGLAALMSFVAAYVERARREHPQTWRALQEEEMRRVVTTLWAQAEQVMANSCRTPGYGFEASGYLVKHVCKADIHHGLGQLLGRPPLCPVSCTRERTAASGEEPEYRSVGRSFRR